MIPVKIPSSQNTEKPDITTTTAIRLLLDQAATVEEAIALLEQYDFNDSSQNSFQNNNHFPYFLLKLYCIQIFAYY